MADTDAGHGTDRDKARLILDNHHQLKRVLERIKGSDDVAHARAQLGELRHVLGSHFCHEEGEDGLFTAVDAQAPHLHSQVQRCREQHQALTAELAGLCEPAQASTEPDQDELWKKILAFVEHLEDHESRETSMFMAAWNDDVGEID